ncbi:MAG: hypothetical protein D6731_16035 [Planctomycetota bacterium]|nr:MAG: hypothetical protein D6731_16035 [Planctomycetota bacterium]
MRGRSLCLLTLALASAAPASAQTKGLDLESWIVIEEEEAPEPPFFQASVGFLSWVEAQTNLRADKDGVRGTRLVDLEEEHGLDEQGIGPWAELSLGGAVRGGADAAWVYRGGHFEPQRGPVLFDGARVAGRNDLLRTELTFFTASGFVEWDLLVGRSYRLGLLGGTRYFRLDVDLRAFGARGSRQESARGELFSPYFGGLIELLPFPYFSVLVRAQFMNWSWSSVGLREARFFEFRLGAKLWPWPRRLSLGVEFRFLSLRASGREARSADSLELALAASGAVFFCEVAF